MDIVGAAATINSRVNEFPEPNPNLPLNPPTLPNPELKEVLDKVPQKEYTGGSVSYYSIQITNPTTPSNPPYTAECNDIIEALGMSYAEGNAFKALWRMCAARLGKSKKGYTDALYDAQKVVFFGERLIEQAKLEIAKTPTLTEQFVAACNSTNPTDK